jgi:hypothetical protein
MAMTAQEYLDTFNTLINQSNYDDAARLVKEADLAGYGDEAYRAAAVALGAKANLPGGSDFIQPEGIQSIRDYVANVTNVDEFNSLIRDDKFREAAAFAQSQGFTPDQVATYVNENAANLELPAGFGVTGENIATLYPGYVAPPAPLSFTDQLNALFQTNLGRLPDEREAKIYAKEFGGTFSPELEAAFLSRSTEEMGNRQKSITEAADAAAKTEKEAADTEAANAAGLPGVGQILGIPSLARQTQSDLTFAPLRRGLAQLRTETYSPGLTSGQRALVGSGFTPAQLRKATQDLLEKSAGKTPEQIQADFAYLMDIGGVSPAERSNVLGQSTKVIQDAYNQARPSGIFATSAPTAPKPFALPEDFALQTGAYGAPTPTFLARPETTAAPFPGQTNANANQPGSISGDGSGDSAGPDPGGFDAGTDSPASVSTRAGGLIRMAEGGGPPKMAELSAKEAGSTFDISKYIDDEGRLVGGYSKPIYDENRVITGYEYRPYERDVVFGEELRGKEAAMRLTDAERKQMMIEMEMRQGRTGISPTTGGLAGISANNLMPSYMRRQPQYYSPAEQFRPRYAEGGLANVAQNLAERGRKGDSMLVHMAPEEVAGLRALARAQGTDMTINPRTGLPEAFSLRKLFKAASFILPFVPIPGLFGMSSLLTKSIFSGIAAGASAKGGFDLKQALGGGLRAYAMGSLGEKMGGAPTPDGAPTVPTTTVGEAAGAVDAAAVSAPQVTVPGVDGDISLAGSYTGRAIPASLPGAPQYEFSVQGPDVGGAGVSVPISLDAPFSPGDPTVPRPEGTPSFVTPEGQGFGKPITKGFDIAAAGIGGLSLEKAAEEQRKYDMEATAIRQEDEERKRRFDELFARTLGSVRTAKAGGTINLAKGGMTYMEAGGTTGPTGEPRMVQGTGDGMSDSVPATIEGVQEARLANDEFVIPADVVADIGNGSSNAGAKKLYNAMDRIRKARHGTTKQPPEIRAERLMPA